MTIPEILKTTEHRPWKILSGKWKYYQEWNNAVFLHWQVDYGELRKLLPSELEIDLSDGKPWISIVAFTMNNIRPRSLPPFPPISDFHEINIRTYVKFKDKDGVYFLSIEAGKRLSSLIAKRLSGLPYRFSKMKRNDGHYQSSNVPYGDRFEIDFKSGERIQEKTDHDVWLTERYALFQENKNAINEFDIHHVEWPLFQVDIKSLNVGYDRFSDLFGRDPDLAHYSPGVQVLAWGKKSNAV